jgi:Mce-associated membrane protein
MSSNNANQATETDKTAEADKTAETEGTASTPDTEPQAESVTEPAAEPKASRGIFRPGVLVPALLVVLLLAGAGYLGFRLLEASAAESARTDALAAGQRYAIDLTTYEHTNLQGNFAAVAANSTEKFAGQYKQVSESLTALIQQYQATSKGTVVKAGIAEADEERAVVVLFVDQVVTNTNNAEPRSDRNRMQMTLMRSGDRWLIDDVQLM